MVRFKSLLRSVQAYLARHRRRLLPWRAGPIWGAVAFASLTVVGLWVFVPQVALAGSALENALIQVVGFIIGFFVNILGIILIKFIGILVAVAQFNNFIDAPAVKVGWSVTRDISNMFFIVALLLIAVGTMFRIDQYRYSRTLQKLIMMAILINFSKAIAGFFIDFSQVVMLTFVNAFKDQAAGSLSAGFGIDKLLTISTNVSAAGGEIETLSVLGSLFAALIMVFVATVIVVIFTILLIQRIIMLWIYIVLAPTAYMVAVLPGSLGSWWSSWWRDFSQYLIKGPVIAFFLWLALTIITLSTNTLIPTTSTIEQQADLQKEAFEKPAFVNEATTGTAIINYLVAIGMLIAGLQQAAKSSGAAGAVAGKWMGNFNKWGGAIATSPLKAGGAVLKRPAYGAAGGALGGAAAAFNSRGLAWTGLGTTFGKMNAKLNRQRLKSEDKDSDWINYADEKTVQRLATSNFATTEGGRRDQKIARERMFKNNEVKNLSDANREKVLNSYHKDIGRKFDAKTGKETFVDAAGGKLLNEAIEKDPTILTAGWGNIDKKESDFREEQMRRIMSKMTPAEMAKMNTKAWSNKIFTDAVLKDPDEKFIKRFEKDKFRDAISTNVGTDVKDDMRAAMIAASASIPSWATPVAPGVARTKGQDYISFQEDIDRDRQARTAARVAAFQKRNLNFHESDEYLKNQGQFYDLQSFNTNLAQEERRVERENLKKHGVSLPVSGASTFASGADNTLGVSEDVLNDAGVKLSAAGTVTDPADKQKLADALSQKLTTDIADVEHQLATAPQDILDSVQEGSGTGTTVRQALQMKVENLKGTQERLQDTAQLGSLKFINADRYGGNVRNAKAEEDFHEKLQEMDQDGSFREQLRQSMSPEQLQQIVREQRAIPGQENIDEKQAFEEHLAKGLANLTRETWADTGPNAVKLSNGLALQVQRQAEAKGVKMHDLTLLQQQANVQVPSRFATVGAGARATVRGATAKVSDVATGTMKKVSGITSKVASGISGAASTVVGGTKKVVSTAASATAGYAVSGAKKVGEVSTAPIRAGQRYLGKEAAAEAEKSRAEIPTGQLGVKVTREGLKAKQQELGAFERQTQQETDQLAQEYQEQKQVMDTAKNRLVAKTAAEKMDGIRKTMAAKAKALKEKRSGVQDYEVMLKNSQESLGEDVGTAYRKGERADQYMAAGQGKPKVTPPPPTVPTPTSSAVTAPPPPPPPPSGQPAAPKSSTPQPPPAAPQAPRAPAAPTSTSQAATSTAEAPQVDGAEVESNVTNITNVTQNITNAFKAAPEDIRGKLQAINSEALDSALKNSIVWRGLMSYIKNNTAEVEKSEKLSDVGREELQKRIGKLQSHMDEGNAEAFKNEFGELQSIFSGGSSSAPSDSEAA